MKCVKMRCQKHKVDSLLLDKLHENFIEIPYLVKGNAFITVEDEKQFVIECDSLSTYKYTFFFDDLEQIDLLFQ